MLRNCVFGIAAVVSVMPAAAQDELKWKFTKGETFYVEEVSQQNQTITIPGQSEAVETKQTTTTVSSIHVNSILSDGSVHLTMRIESSESTGGDTAANEIHKRMEGATFLVLLNAMREVEEFDGYNALIRAISDGNKQVDNLLRLTLTENMLKVGANQMYSVLPRKSVARGDSWEQKYSRQIGMFGNATGVNIIQHAGYKSATDGDSIVELRVLGTAKHEAAKDTPANAPFKLVESDIKFEGISGHGYFDLKVRRLVELMSSVKFKGAMTIEVNGSKSKFKIENSTTVTSRIYDQNPVAK